MNIELAASASAAGLLIGMLALSEVGRRMGGVALARDPDGLKGTGSAAAAVFGLLGLLIAFTFSGAASRFEARRHLITDEANAIGTAYLRLDMLPRDAQPELRELFRRYVDVRASTYRKSAPIETRSTSLAEASVMQGQIWSRSLAACKRPDAPVQAMTLLVPALNEMIDITTTRASATENHPPLVIFLLLGALSLIGALLVGYDLAPNKERSWLHPTLFALMMSLAVYVIIDLEYPRRGLIRVDQADHLLTELRRSMQ
ncbi:bestrophin-like domain [Lysobacter tyrosinilyticus]